MSAVAGPVSAHDPDGEATSMGAGCDPSKASVNPPWAMHLVILRWTLRGDDRAWRPVMGMPERNRFRYRRLVVGQRRGNCVADRRCYCWRPRRHAAARFGVVPYCCRSGHLRPAETRNSVRRLLPGVSLDWARPVTAVASMSADCGRDC